jgi:hypothetical protein
MASTSSCYKAWTELRKRWIRKERQVGQEDTDLMMSEEKQKVLTDTSVTLKDI